MARIHSRTYLLALVTGVLFACIGVGLANENPRTTAGDRTRIVVPPNPGPTAEIRLPSFNRKIFVHQMAQSDPLNAQDNMFAVRPLFALLERSPALDNLPAIVQDVVRHEDGTFRLEFKALLSSPELLQLAERVVRQKLGRPIGAVIVQPWPTHSAIVDVQLDGRLLGTCTTESLITVDGVMDFAIDLSADDLRRFQDGCQRQKVHFRIAHAYTNSEEVSGSSKVKADKSVNRIIEEALVNNLSAAQRDGTALVFQSHVNQVQAITRQRVRKEVRLQDERLYALLNESTPLAGKLFELDREIPWDKLQGDEKLREQATAVLTPLVNQYLKGQDSHEGSQLQRGGSDTSGSGTSLAAGVNIYGLGLGWGANQTTSRSNMEAFTRASGVSFRYEEAQKAYVPTSAKVFRLAQGWQNLIHESHEVAYLSLGSSNSFLEETPVSNTYTTTQVAKLLAEYDREVSEKLASMQAVRDKVEAEERAKTQAARQRYDIAVQERERLKQDLELAKADHAKAESACKDADTRHSQAVEARNAANKKWDDEVEQLRRFYRGELPGHKPPPAASSPNGRTASIEEIVQQVISLDPRFKQMQTEKNNASAALAPAESTKRSATTERDKKLAAMKVIQDKLILAEQAIASGADKIRQAGGTQSGM